MSFLCLKTSFISEAFCGIITYRKKMCAGVAVHILAREGCFMTRQELFEFVKQKYGTVPEYPWNDWNAVLRHSDNRKWYGVILEVGRDKIGLPGAGDVDVLNVKCDPILIGSYRTQYGFFPAYHMNKEKWLSILLGEPKLDDTIKELLALSFELTAPKKGKIKKNAEKEEIV